MTKISPTTYRVLLGLTLAAAATFGWARVRAINPIILGDEYIYAFNSRNFELFTPSKLGNYSNPLFEFTYSATSLCGPGFYECAKAFNAGFLAIFAFLLIISLRRQIPVWLALPLGVAIVLGPMNAYVSMFLPESMMFATIGLIFWSTLKLPDAQGMRPWIVAGASIGLAASVKPHSLMFALAVFIYLLFAKSDHLVDFKSRLTRLAILGFSSLITRLIVGVVAQGPAGVDIFGRYVNSGTVDKVLGAQASGPAATNVPPLESAILQLPDHLTSLSLSVFALTGLASVVILGTLLWLPGFRIGDAKLRNATFISGISALVYVLSVATFSGWVSGTGDDHSARVLLRYADVNLPMIMVVGVAVLAGYNRAEAIPKAVARWIMGLGALVLTQAAFTGYFATKEIQIADAPFLAGLVPSEFVILWTGTLLAIALLTWTSFPKLAAISSAAALVLSSVFAGHETVNQYSLARADESKIERAGDFLAEWLEQNESQSLVVFATSRFDATGALFWSNNQDAIPFKIFPSAVTVPPDLVSSQLVLTIGAIALPENFQVVEDGQGFKLWSTKLD